MSSSDMSDYNILEEARRIVAHLEPLADDDDLCYCMAVTLSWQCTECGVQRHIGDVVRSEATRQGHKKPQ